MTGQCFLHKDHGSAKPLVLVTHHVVPLGMGGPDTPDNKREICDTGHRNTHTILAALIFEKPIPGGSKSERALARLGLDTWVKMGKPGNPHAAYALVHTH